jgi:hypothetical protein
VKYFRLTAADVWQLSPVSATEPHRGGTNIDGDINMMLIQNDRQSRAYALAVQFIRWLALSLATIVVVTAVALGMILFSAWAATAQPDVRTAACVAGYLFEPGPIVTGRDRQPTQAEIDERTRVLFALRTSTRFCP